MTSACGCVRDESGAVVKPCEGAEVPTLVGRAPCGCARYAAVLRGSLEQIADVVREARALERKGWVFEERTVGWVRHGGLNFDCPHQRKRAREHEQLHLGAS